MNSNKFRRAYSLRIPHSPKPSAFLESSGVYDRLNEMEIQDDHHGHNESSGNREHSFSLEIPLIMEAPKLQYCRKKWNSKSLRLPKMRQAEAVSNCHAPEVTHLDHSIWNTANQESDQFSSPDGRRLPTDSQDKENEEREENKQKGKKMKHYKTTIDRAFRRGWGTFISNIYTISLTRTSPDSPHLVKAC